MEAIYLRGHLESKGPLDLSVYVCSPVEGDIDSRLLRVKPWYSLREIRGRRTLVG